MLPVKILNAMWSRGYCCETVEFMSKTEDDERGESARVVWLRDHLPYCKNCNYANILKGLEEETARRLGPQIVEQLNAGDDIRSSTGFEAAFEAAVANSPEPLVKTKMFWTWVNQILHRPLWSNTPLSVLRGH